MPTAVPARKRLASAARCSSRSPPLNNTTGPARIARIDPVSAMPSRQQGVVSVQIKISVRHGHLAEPSQQFIREKAQKLLHLFSRITMIEVTVDLQDEL